MTAFTMPLTQLVEDLTVYPRAGVSDVNVNNLVQALKAGATLPMMVADKKTSRIIDGFHRRRAYLRVLGPGADIEVDLQSYRNKAEMLAAAVSMNTHHGLPLGQFERRQVVLRLEDLGVDDGTIALVLRVPPPRIQRIRAQVATVVNGQGQGIRVEPLKRPLLHFQGQAMTAPQAAAQRSAPGSSYSLLCRQLCDAMNFDLINKNDGRVVAALTELQRVLDTYVANLP